MKKIEVNVTIQMRNVEDFDLNSRNEGVAVAVVHRVHQEYKSKSPRVQIFTMLHIKRISKKGT